MFLAVIMGYAVAAIFAFCGIAQAVFYFQRLDQTMSALEFVSGLAIALWPLAVGVALYVLVQVAMLLERQCIVAENPAEPLPGAPAPRKNRPVPPTRLAPPDPLPSGSYFHAAPASAPPPERKPAPPEDAIPSPMAEGGEEPKSGKDVTRPEAKKQEDLSFFRID